MQRPRDHDLMVTAARLVGIGHSYVAAARAVGRDESTIRRWSNLPAFQAERERAREESIDPSPRRVLIDATRPSHVAFPTRLRVPPEAMERVVLEEWLDPAPRGRG
jgi:hypothetical protein